MTLVEALVFLAILAPYPAEEARPAVYVKGHSHAAEKVRANLQALTCYRSGTELEKSAAILEVDHILERSGRSWIVTVLTDSQHKVLWKRKVEEYPWPLPSSWQRLLKNMAKSTCPDYQGLHLEKSSAQPSSGSPSPSPNPTEALAQQRPR